MEKKKLIAPIVVAVLLGLYYLGVIVLFCMVPLAFALRAAMIVIPAALLGVVVYVLVERIKEIKSGEENDLSNY